MASLEELLPKIGRENLEAYLNSMPPDEIERYLLKLRKFQYGANDKVSAKGSKSKYREYDGVEPNPISKKVAELTRKKYPSTLWNVPSDTCSMTNSETSYDVVSSFFEDVSREPDFKTKLRQFLRG
ncbi:hypothetical protein Ciccas_011070 [Cichlidogyrus casuarinus]|uniref:Uncharacterized protein n=1 Tax=Cichlidogyrus casuarinus TaxID=1844966 RepID=A0ABD2PSR0_9PLAT